MIHSLIARLWYTYYDDDVLRHVFCFDRNHSHISNKQHFDIPENCFLPQMIQKVKLTAVYEEPIIGKQKYFSQVLVMPFPTTVSQISFSRNVQYAVARLIA